MAILHHKINGAELLDTALCGVLQVLEATDVHSTNADHLRARSDGCHLFRSILGLLYIAANNASIGPEMNQRANLSTADGARAAGAEDNFIC